MSREKRIQAAGLVLGLVVTLALPPASRASQTDTAAHSTWAVASALESFWQRAITSLSGLWAAQRATIDPVGEPAPPSDAGSQCVGDCADHSSGIDPNG